MQTANRILLLSLSALIFSLFFSANLFSATVSSDALKKTAFRVADKVFDQADALNQSSVDKLTTLYSEIENILDGNTNNCSNRRTVYQSAYEWAVSTWSSTTLAASFASDVSNRCYGTEYLESYKQAYNWAISTWSSVTDSKTFATQIAEYETDAAETFICYKESYAWAVSTWSSVTRAKAHAEDMCF